MLDEETTEVTASYSRSSIFSVGVTGMIEKVFFPSFNHVYCKFNYSYGSDWSVVAGVEEGVTQIGKKAIFASASPSSSNQTICSTTCPSDPRQIIVWNHPLDITFCSSNPFGWPQLVLAVYGLDAFGHDVIRGYGAVHIPPIPGYHGNISVPVFVPEASSLLTKFKGWLTGNRPEFVDPKVAAQGEGRGVLSVQSTGFVYLNLNIILKDFSQQGYKHS